MRCVSVPVISLLECGGGGEMAFFGAERAGGGGMGLFASGLRVGWAMMGWWCGLEMCWRRGAGGRNC